MARTQSSARMAYRVRVGRGGGGGGGGGGGAGGGGGGGGISGGGGGGGGGGRAPCSPPSRPWANGNGCPAPPSPLRGGGPGGEVCARGRGCRNLSPQPPPR